MVAKNKEMTPSKGTEGEGREFVATDCRIILVTNDVMDSGNELYQTPMRRM